MAGCDPTGSSAPTPVNFIFLIPNKKIHNGIGISFLYFEINHAIVGRKFVSQSNKEGEGDLAP
jgi:hypothetical protein